VASLNGRLTKLERLAAWRAPHEMHCRACGLEHVPAAPSIAMIRSVIGPPACPVPAGWPPPRTEPFCGCRCCAHGRAIAELVVGQWPA
jgi:hypothetical protein